MKGLGEWAEFYLATIKWRVYASYDHALYLVKVGTKGRKRYVLTDATGKGEEFKIRLLDPSGMRALEEVARGRIIRLS